MSKKYVNYESTEVLNYQYTFVNFVEYVLTRLTSERYQSAWFSLIIGIGIYSLIYTDKSLHALNHQGINSHICMMFVWCTVNYVGIFWGILQFFYRWRKMKQTQSLLLLFMCTNNAQKQHWSKGADLNMLQN